ncbi:MAG TPA: hypothetical protein VF173_13240 [Thermoanaerobaculia bacterium]|nr:hypothetical protein [Thermoanaerobaculia bacterium]
MPGFLLNATSAVQCTHGGSAKPTLRNPRVKVMGQNVITCVSLYTISGCPFPPPPSGNGPCVMAQWTTSALRVRANGLPVLLMDSQATCTPTGTPLLPALAQLRVKGT